ncbi:anthranilate phosphoribosyltransferase [Heliobacterium gestii]|uniref:Anthranilate phosphoribosyltransferase n=1 Tax=Heliomicrobium gestii TaxID=2699 RepID=A0A845L9U6_HELGE|nr:anthranilate phosphoribosyltransferase [Heliomicrobium gestii]MBM7865445.1 anthranilate phosphoribosyltransferase [Heliomicrobium gestii]MZP41700.1 anthranilate phosphoribosyltransferase [Heliomicrobium gestii]
MSQSIEIAKHSLQCLLSGERLGEGRAEELMNAVMEGKVPSVQLAALLVALRLTGEGEEEIAGFARSMRSRVGRELAEYIPAGFEAIRMQLVDTCGTGGDGAGTFNISTTAALVVAAAGVPVAKHGNRAMSGRAGSADVLEALGVTVDLSPDHAYRCLMETGFGFFFAPQCHRAMAHAAPTRRELGVPTVFNLLGPLSNPAGAVRQLLGVNSAERVPVIAQVLRRLGATSAWVVHGEDGLDEITLTGPTTVARLNAGEVQVESIDPRAYGFDLCAPDDLKGGDRNENAAITAAILNGEKGHRRHIVILNAAAALCISGKVNRLEEGIALARSIIDGGEAAGLLERVKKVTAQAASLREGGMSA